MATSSTLVRIGIFGFVLSVIAAFAWFIVRLGVPSVVGSGQAAAEGSAVSHLRTLLWAQDKFLELSAADRDGDGRPEYGFLGELAGLVQAAGGKPLPAPLLQNEAGQLLPGHKRGVTLVSGYCFTVYLPGTNGRGVAELEAGGEAPDAVDANGAEKGWVAYAWPSQLGRSGFKVFYINQDEEIWQSANDAPGQHYDGPDKGPAFNAALPTATFSDLPSDTALGSDGGKWVRWKGKQGRKR